MAARCPSRCPSPTAISTRPRAWPSVRRWSQAAGFRTAKAIGGRARTVRTIASVASPRFFSHWIRPRRALSKRARDSIQPPSDAAWPGPSAFPACSPNLETSAAAAFARTTAQRPRSLRSEQLRRGQRAWRVGRRRCSSLPDLGRKSGLLGLLQLLRHGQSVLPRELSGRSRRGTKRSGHAQLSPLSTRGRFDESTRVRLRG